MVQGTLRGGQVFVQLVSMDFSCVICWFWLLIVTASVPERRSMLYSELLTCGSEEEKTLSRAELKAVVEVLAAVFSALAALLSEVEVAEIELPLCAGCLGWWRRWCFCCVKIARASDPPGHIP